MRQHFTNLAQATRNYSLTHRHILKQLGWRAEKLAAVFQRHMWRQQDLAGVEQSRNAFVLDMATENHVLLFSSRPNNSLNFFPQPAPADEQEANPGNRGQQSNRLG